MFAIGITSFASGSRAAALGCGGAAVAGGAALSLHDRSATARKIAVLGRIGARKIAKPGGLHKRRSSSSGGTGRPPPGPLEQLQHQPGLLLGIAQQRGGARRDRLPLVSGVSLPLLGMRPQVVAQEQRVTPERAFELDDLRVEGRSEEHTSELQSPCNLVCRLLLEKKKIEDK